MNSCIKGTSKRKRFNIAQMLLVKIKKIRNFSDSNLEVVFENQILVLSC